MIPQMGLLLGRRLHRDGRWGSGLEEREEEMRETIYKMIYNRRCSKQAH